MKRDHLIQRLSPTNRQKRLPGVKRTSGDGELISLNQTVTFFPSATAKPGAPSPSRHSMTPSLNQTIDGSLLFPQAIRGHSLERKESVYTKYDELQTEYNNLKQAFYKLKEEKEVLVREKCGSMITNGSSSTVLFSKDFDAEKQSLAHEVEELHTLLSATHQSIDTLLNTCEILSAQYEEANRQLNLVKYNQELHDSTKDVKINLLEETLNKKNDEMKQLKKERKRLENALRDSEASKRELEAENKSLESKLKVLDGTADKELLTVAELQQQLTMANQMLAHSEKKVARYERYIQNNLKEKR